MLAKFPDYRLTVQPRLCLRNQTHLHSMSFPSTIKCTLIPGDGVGPELVKSVKTIFKSAKVPIEFERHIFSELNPEQSESLENVVRSITKNRICLQGIVATPGKSPDGHPLNWNMRLRESLDLYANVVHFKSLKGVPCKHASTNFMLIRDQTEGSNKETMEHETVKGVIESLKLITRKKSERIAKFALDYAMTHNKKKLVAVHKANVFRITDGIFLESCRKIAANYPKISFSDMSIGSCAFQLTNSPQQFDIILTPSLYGSVIESIAIGMVGGVGVVSGNSYSPRCAVFEPGSREINDVANPTGMILSAIKLLRQIKLLDYANVIEDSVLKVLKDGECKTPDMGGDCTILDFTRAVINNLNLSKIDVLTDDSPPNTDNLIYKLSTCM